MSQGRWKFHVHGSFVRVETGEVVTPCEAIIESGVRDENSPFDLEGVGPVAHADDAGTFNSWFVTKGSTSQASAPASVSVCIRVARGKWLPHIVPVVRSQIVSQDELLLYLENVQIEHGQAIYAES